MPDAWHGPSVVVPGHDMYYVNAIADWHGPRPADLRPPRPCRGSRHLGRPTSSAPLHLAEQPPRPFLSPAARKETRTR
ncbi:5-deoxy-glucuronate isomerase [Streptomyces sp. S3(2020)]|uniref:5-deoxy-glucuronate isomerase n=1 Tax=Streptomyces sp. S3(2020) TaxID=2732044 RepID=UPI001F10FD2C|nr:5-deoxy-glucuronate isomerase [Streptomyces sp. S3(2020)]